jgi:hypothetical protein
MRSRLLAFPCALLCAAAGVAQCTNLLVPMPFGADAAVLVLQTTQNGDIVLAGEFTTALGVPANRIARWNGASVTPLGAGLNGPVRAVLELPNGDLVVAGSFSTAGGAPANNIARWNGSAWSPLGTGVAGSLYALARRSNGDLFAGGDFADRVRRWDGSTWSSLGLAAVPFPGARALQVLPNDDLVACAPFLLIAGTQVHYAGRWDGAVWTPMLGVPSGGLAAGFKVFANGDLHLLGAFLTICILRWDGASWVALPSSVPFGGVYALDQLPNGDLLAGGTFFYIGTDPTARNFARWNGATWSPFGAGVNGPVLSQLVLPSGDVLFGGSFTLVDGQPASNLALLTTTCPATAVVGGAGCAGSAGPVTLAATTLPWVGAVARSRATGLPANAFAVGVLGFAPVAIALPTLLPQGVAGCSLWARPDLLSLHAGSAGAAELTITVPNAAELVGQVLHQQAAVVELAPGGAIAAVTSSNALVLTIGRF